MNMEENGSYFKGLSRQDYIQKAYEIIKSEGIKAVSIRRLAREMGCSSTSLYRYFSSREELIYYAELPTLRTYIDRLKKGEETWKNIWEMYVGVWYCYSQEAFRHPEAYDLLFFRNIDVEFMSAIKEYYHLFPEDIKNTSQNFQEMLQTSDYQSRDMVMCRKCVHENVLTQENAVKLNRMVCMMFGGYLKTILEHGIEPEEVEERVKTFISDVDSIVHLLASDLCGYSSYL